MNQKQWIKIATLGLVGLISLTGCTLQKQDSGQSRAQSNLPASGNPADQVGIIGVQGASVPTSKAISARITNGLQNNSVPTSGNFAKSLAQLGTNLPENTNPNLATGYDQVPLLAYAACTDVAPSVYGITQTGTGANITNARMALIAAGVKIMDQHTGGLASTGPLASQVSTIFGKLVDDNAAISGETVLMEFVSVCMSASTFGVQMMGF
jgi:hypothetical protein